MNLGRTIIGGLLILAGVDWLARNSGLDNWIAAVNWGEVWPVILIFLGLAMFDWEGKRGVIVGSLVTLLTIAMVIWLLLGNGIRLGM